ncbi:MAG: type VI secretion system tube protein Hcp [Rhodospirillales bacterium]|nr:type VI secretion system tube protein Hcp [Rhodospirillales bacterium]
MADIYVEMTGIPGNATAKGYENQIVVDSCQWGAHNAAPVTGGSASGAQGGGGKASFSECSMSKQTDKASAPLMLHCATGKHIPTTKISFVSSKNDNTTQLEMKITLTDCLVSSYSNSGHGGGSQGVAMDMFSLAFAKIEFEHNTFDAKGKPTPSKAMYDVTSATTG